MEKRDSYSQTEGVIFIIVECSQLFKNRNYFYLFSSFKNIFLKLSILENTPQYTSNITFTIFSLTLSYFTNFSLVVS